MNIDIRDIIEFLKDSLKFILVVVIVLFIVIYIVSLHQVVGPSMSPTLNNGNTVIVNKIGYKLFGLKRNDIVVVNNKDTEYLIKRVIGLPGEVIEYKNNVLFINNKPYDETFLTDTTVTNDFSITKLGYVRIPEDKYLVLGDNRENSMDSRDLGLIDKKNITARVFFRLLPIKEIKIVK